MKERFISAHMEVAKIYAGLSYARRRKVGAVIVKDNRIISIGYNGTPSGWDNNCEYINEQGELVTKPEVLHAETNAIAKVAQSSESCLGASLFVTLAPCVECAKLIYQSGIKEVFFNEDYKCNGLQFLKDCGITVEKI